MTDTCLCCPVLRRHSTPRRPNRPAVCDGCRERLQRDLEAISAAYYDDEYQPVRGSSEILTRVFESKPPLDLTELSLRGDGFGTPRAILSTLCRVAADDLKLGELPIDNVSEMVGWLGRHLQQLCDEHMAIDEIARDIRQIAGELHVYERAADKAGTRIGNCPRIAPGEVSACGAPLACDPYDTVISCPRCGTSWHRDRRDKHGVPGWVKLRAAQLEREGEAA